MNSGDITLRTAIFILSAIFFVYWAMVGLVFKVNTKSSIGFMLANISSGLGCALVVYRYTQPNFLTIQLADWLLICAFSAFNFGIVRLTTRKARSLPLYIAPIALEIMATAPLAANSSSYAIRALVFNFTAASTAFFCFFSCMKGLSENRASLVKRWAISLSYALTASIFSFKLISIMWKIHAEGMNLVELPVGLIFNLWTVFIILIIVNMSNTALILDRVFDRFATLASIDPLTGQMNRRALLNSLHAKGRQGDQLSCILFDLDDFKLVNDCHGHHVGDQALVHVSTTVQAMLRSVDELGRYGGEEFIVILPATPLLSALTIAERIRHAIATSPLATGAHHIQMTSSLGVAELHPDENVESMIGRADRAMYAAKHHGRNRVIVAEPFDTADNKDFSSPISGSRVVTPQV